MGYVMPIIGLTTTQDILMYRVTNLLPLNKVQPCTIPFSLQALLLRYFQVVYSSQIIHDLQM